MNWETFMMILFSPLLLAEIIIAIIVGILLIHEILQDWRK